MKYSKLVLFLFFIQILSAHAEGFKREPGFFGSTRTCLRWWQEGLDYNGICFTSFIPFVLGDVITAPTETAITVTDLMNKITSVTSSSDKTAKSDSSSTTSHKTTNSGSSFSNKDQASEIPEEKKVILQKPSLFVHLADDARDYIITRTSTSLLDAAVIAMRPANTVSDEADYTVNSQKILELESEVLQAFSAVEAEK
jgi:hypothetical protein